MSLTQKAQVRFNKGLITEAGELTFPEGASIDESNCTLERTGERKRRLGIEYEDAYSLSTDTISKGSLVSVGEWVNVGGQSNLQYAVVQLGAKLYFYNKSVSPISGQAVPVSDADPTIFSVDLTAYETGTASASRVQLASVRGALVVVSPDINPFYIERDNSTGVFSQTQINFKVRDFEYLGDKSSYDTEVATASLVEERKYDTANCGWTGAKGAAALAAYETANTAYPPLTHPWYSGKDSSGVFQEAEWQKVYSGTSLIANGHFVLDLFSKDRKAAFEAESAGAPSTTLTYPTEVETTRFKTVTAFAGRVFFAGLSSSKNSSKIYFSRQIDLLTDMGDCYQVNDPTSEEISDLLATDGGFILIPDAHSINKLAVLGASLIVFAENGVWEIKGVNDIFKATAYSVRKITDTGLIATGSYVRTEDSVFWWSPAGIHVISYSPDARQYVEQNISLNSIQTFYNNIKASSKINVISEYDAINKKVFWLYASSSELLDYKYNEILILDIPLKAFIPWSISDTDNNTPYIAGTAFFKGVGYGDVVHNVVDSSGNLVVDSSGNQVVATYPDTTTASDSEIKFLVRDGITGKITFATFTSPTFKDWGSADYTSYAEAGYDFLGDMSTRKTVPYINVYTKLTETGWQGNETDGYTPVREGALKMTAYWDFKTTGTATPQNVYRLKYLPTVDPSDLSNFNYPHTVLNSKVKLRGSGRTIRLRFESDTGKDFNLLGFEVIADRSNKF